MPTRSWSVFRAERLSMRRALTPQTTQLQPPQWASPVTGLDARLARIEHSPVVDGRHPHGAKGQRGVMNKWILDDGGLPGG